MNPPLSKKQKHFAVFFCTVLGITVIGCILSLFFMQKKQAPDSIVSVYQNGQLLQTISLSSVETPYQIRIDGADGAYNIIEVRPGSIGVVKASCPDHICVNRGFQSRSLLPITCLPNRLVLLFTEKPDNRSEVDIATY